MSPVGNLAAQQFPCHRLMLFFRSAGYADVPPHHNLGNLTGG
jgi:hypothetical protein